MITLNENVWMLIKLLSASIRKQTQNKENHKMVIGSDGYHKKRNVSSRKRIANAPSGDGGQALGEDHTQPWTEVLPSCSSSRFPRVPFLKYRNPKQLTHKSSWVCALGFGGYLCTWSKSANGEKVV